MSLGNTCASSSPHPRWSRLTRSGQSKILFSDLSACPFPTLLGCRALSCESLSSNGTVIPSKLVYFSQAPTELEGQIYSLIYSHPSLHKDYKRKRKVVRGEGTSVCWVALCSVCAQPFTDVLPFSVCKCPPPYSLHSTGEQMVAPRG